MQYRAIVIVIGLLAVFACSGNSDKKPAGTMLDPVDVCERLADVCRLDKSRLGVCTAHPSGQGFVCVSQH